jgi:hypothetical protein
MTFSTTALDHLVVAARTLEQGTDYVRDCLGVAPVGGGRHAAMGTHNRVLKLGCKLYLEVISVDPDGRQPETPRWFDLGNPDLQEKLKTRPRLVAWVVRTDAIDALVETVYDRPATVRPMQRNDFKWQFAFTADGSLPLAGPGPHLIQWDSLHPAGAMAESGCELLQLSIAAHDPGSVHRVLNKLKLDDAVEVQPASKQHPQGMSATIRTPNGLMNLK